MSKHPIVHVEISALDREAAGQFYADLFGWHVQQMPEMNYAMFSAEEGDEGPGGGFSPVSDDNPAGTVMFYIGTDDVDASLAKAEKLGGKALVPRTEIPGMGWFGVFSDPSGNKIGVFQSAAPPS